MQIRHPSWPGRCRAPHGLVIVAAAAALAGPAWAQTAPAGGGFTLTPTFTAEESYLETRSRIVGDNGREAVTRLAPGLRLSSRSGRVQGSLDYTGSLFYRLGREASRDREFQNALNAAFQAEAVTNWAFIDARASVSQQSVSAFGQQSASGSAQSNSNRTEVATASLSPYVKGALGGWADYEVRLTAAATKTRDDTAGDSRNTGGSVLLQSPNRGALLGWALTASQQRSEFTSSASGAVDNGRVNATITFAPAPELRFSLSGGRESIDDGALAERRVTTTANLAFQWVPSPRTALNVDLGERYFGRTSRVLFSHRAQRSAWTYSLTRDTSTGADSQGQPLTVFQLFFAQAESTVPDPVQRERFVLDLLAAQGLDPNQIVAPGVLTSSYSLLRRQDLSYAWLGQRLTLSLQAFTSSQSQLITVGAAEPTLGEAVRLHGYSSSLAYKLTPQTTVSLGGSRQMTFATSTQAGNDLKSANLNLTSQLGRRTSAQLGARYSVFNSDTDPYRETSVSASLSLRY